MNLKSNLASVKWFAPLVFVLLIGLAVFGGMVVWKLARSAAPSVEKAQRNPDQLLEQTEQGVSVVTQLTSQKGAEGQMSTTQKNEDEFFGYDGYEHEGMVQPSQEPQKEEPKEEVQTVSVDTSEEQTPLRDLGISDAEIQRLLRIFEQEEAARARHNSAGSREAKGQVNAKSHKPVDFQTGLNQCKRSKVFPCAWEGPSENNLIKQFWLESAEGPIERVIHRDDGQRVSETLLTLRGTILSYKGVFAELYFKGGMLAKIRTSPYDNPNLHDWFFINDEGKLDVCMCAMTTKNCCARSLFYREGGSRQYCDLFQNDTDFCKK